MDKSFSRKNLLSVIESREGREVIKQLFYSEKESDEMLLDTIIQCVRLEEQLALPIESILNTSLDLASEKTANDVKEVISSIKVQDRMQFLPKDSQKSINEKINFSIEKLSKIPQQNASKKDIVKGASLRVIKGIARQESVLFSNLEMRLQESKRNRIDDHRKDGWIFLSSQYNDHLFSLGLYILFYLEGFELYVDWMRNCKQQDSESIKKSLYGPIVDSQYFFLLPDVNSAFNYRKGRPENKSVWCTWELGVRDQVKYYSRQENRDFQIMITKYQDVGTSEHTSEAAVGPTDSLSDIYSIDDFISLIR